MQRINVYRYPEDEPRTLDGWFDLDRVTETVEESTRWDGNNAVSVHVDRFEHQVLYRTAQGRWVLHHWSQWQGHEATYTYVDDERARQWLIRNESDDVIERYFGALEEERGPGRPAIGPVIGVRLGNLLDRVDERARLADAQRPEMIRRLLEQALSETGGTLDEIHPFVRDRIAAKSATATRQPVMVSWSARPGTVHHGEGGHTWAFVTAQVEWGNGATASADLRICTLGVQPRDLGLTTAVDFAVADAVAALLTTEVAHEIEVAAMRANEAWQSGEYGADGGPCVCGEIYPDVRHPRRDGCPTCDAAWASLADR
jgi:hypothetical protein